MKRTLTGLLLFAAGMCITAHGNITFSKNGIDIIQLKPNGSIRVFNGLNQNQTFVPEQGRLEIAFGTSKKLWTNMNNTVQIAGSLYQKATFPLTGLRLVQGIDPKAELSSQGHLYLKDGAFIVSVEEIHFNWTTSSHTTDALNIRKDGATAITVPEFKKSTSYNAPAAYLCNIPVSIKVKFSVLPTTITSLNIQGVSAGSIGGILPNTEKKTVTFTNGTSDLVTFNLRGSTAPAIKAATQIWDWNVEDGATTVTVDRTSHRLYTLYAAPPEPPQSPWVLAQGATCNPWSRVLEYACVWADGETNSGPAIVKKITEGAYYYFPKKYDGTTHSTVSSCALTALLDDGDHVDCQDMGAVVQLFSQILGVLNVQVQRIKGPFLYNPILPIGCDEWWKPGVWILHQFGWYENTVYDACFQLNQNNPRIPVHEIIDKSYKDDLYRGEIWEVFSPNTILQIY